VNQDELPFARDFCQPRGGVDDVVQLHASIGRLSPAQQRVAAAEIHFLASAPRNYSWVLEAEPLAVTLWPMPSKALIIL
jgi:hypothetical protein